MRHLAFCLLAMTLPGIPARAQDDTPPCGPDAQGLYTTECHTQLLALEREAQHGRSYRLGYSDGCAGSSVDTKFQAIMAEDAAGGFRCNVSWEWRTGQTVAIAGGTTIVPAVPGTVGPIGSSSSIRRDPDTAALIERWMEGVDAGNMLEERGFELRALAP